MDDIGLQSTLNSIGPEHLQGFFEGWPHPPSPDTLHRTLLSSYRFSVAVHQPTGEVVGFVQAISDGVLTAFIPLLEVRPAFRRQGLGRALVAHLLAQLGGLYAVDLSCDDELAPYYERLGFTRGVAMVRRVYANQNGRS